MFIVSSLLDRYSLFRLCGKAYREEIYRKALRQELRGRKMGEIILRNLGIIMAGNPGLHDEFASLVGKENYQKSFWESDLGYLWYLNNFEASNSYFDFAIRSIQANNCKSVLDVGCGWGRFCGRVAETGIVPVIKGIDISESIISKAKGAVQAHGIVFECKEALDEKGFYDLITLFGSADYISALQFEQVLLHLIKHTVRQLIVINSLRGIALDKANQLQQAVEVKRYDDGYVQPLNYLLTKHNADLNYRFEIMKYGSDSAMAIVTKN